MAVDKSPTAPSVGNIGLSATSTSDPDEGLSPADALALAEAEVAEAEAMAAAARARARAIRLRRQAAKASGSDAQAETNAKAGTDATDADHTDSNNNVVVLDKTQAVPDETPAVEKTDSQAIEGPDLSAARPRLPWLRLPRLLRVALTVAALLVVCALVLATGYMLQQHQKATAQRQRVAEFTAGARQGVITLMSIDFNHAKQDVQRIIDNSTGQFKSDFQAEADDMVKACQDAKAVTTATVSSAAVQSMTDKSAVVLVSASSEVTNAAGAQKDPRNWRLSVTVARDGGQLKLSAVEFVP